MIVAVLLANSVKQARNAVISITAAAGGTSAKGWRWPPIQAARPDSCWCTKIWVRGQTSGLKIRDLGQWSKIWVRYQRSGLQFKDLGQWSNKWVSGEISGLEVKHLGQISKIWLTVQRSGLVVKKTHKIITNRSREQKEKQAQSLQEKEEI